MSRHPALRTIIFLTIALPSIVCAQVAPPSPTGLTYQCNSDGTQVTLSWDATPGATSYSPNVNSPLSCPTDWYPRSGGGGCNQGYGTAGPLITTTSTTFSTTPGQVYSWYLYAVNGTDVDWSKPAAGQVFTCNPKSLIPPVSEYSNIHGTVFFDPLFDTAVSDDLAADILSSDIGRMKAAGLNTVWLHDGWGQFETNISPPTYDQAAFSRLKTLLSILQANNMKAMIVMDPFVVPSGLNNPFDTKQTPWIEVPNQWQSFITFSNYFLTQILPYKDTVYVFDGDLDIYDPAFWNDPVHAAQIEQATLGDWPAQLDPSVRSQFKLGFEDMRLLNTGITTSLQTSPIANPNPFDWLSFSYYPQVNGMQRPADVTTYPGSLDASFATFDRLYPSTPTLIVEMGYSSCAAAGGEAQQNSSIQTMMNYAVQHNRGFDLWSWEPALAPMNLSPNGQLCGQTFEHTLGLIRPDGSEKTVMTTVQSMFNPSGSMSSVSTVPSWVSNTNQPYNSSWIPPAAFNAAIQMPPSMRPGTTYPVSVIMKNTGTAAWKPGQVYLEFLGTRGVSYITNNPSDLWGTTDVQIPQGTTVQPGQQFTFNFNVKAPAAPQPYYFVWRMRTSSDWFGQPTTPSYSVVVDTNAPQPVPQAPTGLSYICNANGTQATFSWNVSSDATSYIPNVNTSSTCPSGWYSNGAGGCGQGYGMSSTLITATSTTFATTPGQQYSWYLYAVNNSGVNYSDPTPGQVFTCAATGTPQVATGGGGGGGGGSSTITTPVSTSSTSTVASSSIRISTSTTLINTHGTTSIQYISLPPFTKNLSLGSRGIDVALVQAFLVLRGYLDIQYMTGYYGLRTQAAIRAYQKAHNIRMTGSWGPLTRASANAVNTTQ